MTVTTETAGKFFKLSLNARQVQGATDRNMEAGFPIAYLQ